MRSGNFASCLTLSRRFTGYAAQSKHIEVHTLDKDRQGYITPQKKKKKLMMKIVGCVLNGNVSTFLIATTSMLYLLQGIQYSSIQSHTQLNTP